MTAYKFFKGINAFTTIDDIKAQYRKLAIANHPDMGGSVEAMAEINAEYMELCRRYGNVHKAANGSTYEKETEEKPSDFIAIIDALIRMGVDFEIVGTFVWISGNTYAHKDELKEMGCKWSSERRMWYLAPKDWKAKRRNMSFDEIKDVYGVQYSHKAAGYSGIVAA